MQIRLKSCRCAVVLLVLALSALPLSARGLSSAGKVIGKAIGWISRAMADYAVGKAIDKSLGQDVEQDLETLRRDLETRIQQANSESVGRLREQLEVTNSELEMVRRLLKGKPSQEEFQIFRDQVSGDFAKTFSRLEEHDQRLKSQQAEIQDLRQRIESLEEFYPRRRAPVPGNLPADPRVVILAIGEPILANAIETELGKQLRASGLEVTRGSSSLQVSDLVRKYGEAIAVGKLVPLFDHDGQHVLVLARVEIVGYRELTYYGRISELTDARLRLNAYLLHDERAMATEWNDPVSYTALNADFKAAEVLEGTAPEISEAIARGWRAHRTQAGY